jgi:hypothetical protein
MDGGGGTPARGRGHGDALEGGGGGALRILTQVRGPMCLIPIFMYPRGSPLEMVLGPPENKDPVMLFGSLCKD